MADFLTLPVSKIHVPKDRAREIDIDHALAIQASIVEDGQITPILVRKTPRGKTPYTLIAGGHRHKAIEILDDDSEIDCLLVSADKDTAAILEVSENVFRNELTALDRAIAVQVYRDAWEAKNGKIKKTGRPMKSTANLAVLLQDEAESGFSASCADRLGLSKRAVERANQIARNVPPELRKKLQGTPIADNQAQLEKLAKLAPEQRAKASKAFDLAEGDFAATMAILDDKPAPKKPTRDQQNLNKLIDTWSRSNGKVRTKFLEHIEPVGKGSK